MQNYLTYLIKDDVVYGIRCEKTARLLRIYDLILEHTTDICQAAKYAVTQLKDLGSADIKTLIFWRVKIKA